MFPFKERWRIAFVLGVYLAFVVQNGFAADRALSVGVVQTVIAFDPSLSQFPEGLAVDKQGNIYAALTFTGNVWKLSPEGEQSILAHLDVGNGLLVGLAVGESGDLYVCDASFEAATHGIWKIDREGSAQLFASLDMNGFPNAMAFDNVGNLFVTDSFLGQIYKISKSGEITVWLADPLLAPGNVIGVGANGIEFDSGYAFVANTDQGTVLRIKAEDNPPLPEVFIQDSKLFGADGIAFDVLHNLYVAVDIQNTVVRIGARRDITTLAMASDGLDYPASTSFGQGSAQRTFLFWTNGGINFGTPSIQKLQVRLPGVPLP